MNRPVLKAVFKPAGNCIPRKIDNTPAVIINLLNQTFVDRIEMLGKFFCPASRAKLVGKPFGKRSKARYIGKESRPKRSD